MSDQPELVSKELRHVLHVRATKSNPDIHVIRETSHYSDGTSVNSTRVLQDYKRPFYITMPQHRSYKQHKEREKLSKLARHDSTQTDLPKAIATALGKRMTYGSLRDMCNDPYVFGASSTSCALIRKLYNQKWPVPPTPLKYAAYDLETCVFDPDGHIIIASIAMDDVVKIFINQTFVEGIPNPIETIKQMEPALYEKYGYTTYMENCVTQYSLHPSEQDVIIALAAAMHEFDPDVVAAWNHDFDVNKLDKRCAQLHISAADIFSHPAVPPEARRFRFIEGKREKITANGTFRPLQPSEQWHNIQATTGFLWLDAMCVYRRLRSQNAFLSSYGIDNIASIHLGVGKMHTDETEYMDGLSRHMHMQQNDKLTYCVYAALDVRLMVLLERQTKDITLRLPTELAGSDFFDTASSSQRTVDMFAKACEEDGYILGTVGSDPDKFPEPVVPLSGWPLTLPNDLQAQAGANCIAEYPTVTTHIYTCCLSQDVTSAYPTLIRVLNISKATTKYEFVRLEGINCLSDVALLQNLNIFGGSVNAMDYMQKIYSWPTLSDIDLFLK